MPKPMSPRMSDLRLSLPGSGTPLMPLAPMSACIFFSRSARAATSALAIASVTCSPSFNLNCAIYVSRAAM